MCWFSEFVWSKRGVRRQRARRWRASRRPRSWRQQSTIRAGGGRWRLL